MALRYEAHHVFARLSPEQEIKYYNSSSLSLKDPALHPFGLASFKLPKDQAGLIMVEGPYDWMKTVQNLQDLGIADAFSVVALLGVSHWDSFFKKLELRLAHQMRDTPIILAFDHDKAGDLLTKKAADDCRNKLLWQDSQILKLPYNYQTQDPGKMDKKELKTSLLKLGF